VTPWQRITEAATQKAVSLPEEYRHRLKYEISEISRQGANDYWLDVVKSGKQFATNPNGLVLPFVLGLTPIDPIKAGLPHKVVFQTDLPDIDCDLQPQARPFIKQYAIKKYGADKVCSVGLWQTYKPKLALQDTARALGADVKEVMALTKDIPDEFDDMPLEEALKEFDEFATYAKAHLEIVQLAYRIVGRIKTQGRHAGGLIISSVPIREHIPLMKLGDEWTTAWTEGKSTQLSKFGFVKFDMLGLKTIQYIWQACQLIKANRNVIIDWDKIPLDDEKTLKLAADLKTDSTFQFETSLAKSIIDKGGVKSFNDLLVYTSLGRPGPLPLIDEYIARRDDQAQTWRRRTHIKIAEILADTFGIIVFQEQLQQVWIDICGFTYAEAESARKIIAKKWQDKLPALGKKVVDGAQRLLSKEEAEKLWEDMVSFGRYAFNLAHGTAYTIIAYRTLYLKAYFPAEWWAAVLSGCQRERLVRYIGVAKREGVQFGTIDCRALTESFTVAGDSVVPGLNCVKNIGTAAKQLAINNRDYVTIDEFITQNGKHRIVLERLIKLGAFDALHQNRKALWQWYLYKHMGEKEAKLLVEQKFGWPKERISAERESLMTGFRKMHPKRKLPAKIEKWMPKISPSMEEFLTKMDDIFTTSEILEFEKTYLGFYWSSPMDQYEWHEHTIATARLTGRLECVIEDMQTKKTEKTSYLRLRVTDGIEETTVVIWKDDAADRSNAAALKAGTGVSMRVNWSDKYKSFSMASGGMVLPLIRRGSQVCVEEPADAVAE
jgi:DNA polymerase-3 subunit alpha